MIAKLIILNLMIVLLAGTLLVLRQDRLHTAGQVTDLYRQCRNVEMDIWRVQSRLDRMTSPVQLPDRIASAGLQVEPLVPVDPLPPSPRLAQSQHR